jgi:hypothetical protein
MWSKPVRRDDIRFNGRSTTMPLFAVALVAFLSATAAAAPAVMLEKLSDLKEACSRRETDKLASKYYRPNRRRTDDPLSAGASRAVS